MKIRENKPQGRPEQPPEEDEVRVSNDWYRAIYDGSPLAMIVWDLERRVVDWNRHAEMVFGWTSEEILGKDFFEFLLPESALPAVAGIVDLLLAGRLPSRSINENLTKRGETILCEWNNSIQRDSQGKVTGVISLALDITEQKRAEDVLRLFKESVENSSDAVGMSTPEGKHYFQNKAFDELFGPVGENPSETVYVDPAVGHEVFRTIMAGGVWLGEVQMYARDWRVLTILLRAYASKDQAGRIAVLVGVHTDITGRKQAEEALREAAIKWQTTFNALESALWLLDKDMRIVVANDATQRVFRVDHQEVVGRHCWEIVHGSQEPIAECPVVGSQQTLRRESMELQVGHQWYEVTADPVIGDAGALLGFVHVVNNITERRKIENERREFETRLHQAQRLESLGVLAGGIAHDFNNILMAIMGRADLALYDLSPFSPARESLAEIVLVSKRAADLCGQMLAYAGKSRVERRNMSLGDLVEETLHMLKACISKKAILNLNLEKAFPCMHGDPAQIRQILMNLVINASDAIGERSGVITISTGAMDCSEQYLAKGCIVAPGKPGTYVYIEVSDTGCGMDTKTIERIFEPFFTTKFTGRGLGLSAVMGIVTAHEGALRVYSEPGKGSTFKVMFPGIEAAEEEKPEGGVSGAWRGSGTVLLVDDEETIRAVSSEQLRRLGLEVLTAEDGRQAVDVYRERRADIDLVLLDLTMPHMNGEEAYRELRQITPDVRVIIASGYSENDIASRFAGKGLAGCLQKPYTLTKLRSLLSTLLPKVG